MGKSYMDCFFDILKNANERLAEQVHEEDNYKPFTVSSILGKRTDRLIIIEKGRKYYIRITFLNEEAFNFFTIKIFKSKYSKEKLKINDIEFYISNVIFHEKQSKWAGILTENELLSTNYNNNVIKLRFYTPTLFRIGDKHLGYPFPDKVFKSLLKKFNKYAEFKINEDYANMFSDIEILNKRTYKKRVYMRNYYLDGFIGTVEYKIPTDDRNFFKVIHMLADFAFFSGVGYKTTMGFGQVKKLGE
ncbi:CRISPR-associated endoribonuclease Cas6 [Thermosipho sp. 1070]|uniref:CRISPR-associated endoribonuclease Cas6 n=2 Tax=Thermosipho TaxID=2420 RepID=UPI003003492C